MTEEQQPAPETPDGQMVGMAELSTRSRLQSDWQTVSIEQTGPDGTETLYFLIFYVCPICAATIAPGNEENNLVANHSEFHIRQARDFDVLNRVLSSLVEMLEEKPDPLLNLPQEK